MVRVSFGQKPYRRVIMRSFGAEVQASPSEMTDAGRAILAADPTTPGSLGIAISEAVEVAAKSGGAKKYALGSVLNHVLTHQTVIGQEALAQMELAGEFPDVVVACAGGGSNLAGIALPFVHLNLTAGKSTRILATEPAACPSLTRGVYAYDFGDAVGMTPLIKMHTLGRRFIPPPVHAGGLRYHGMASVISELYDQRLIEAVAIGQVETFEAARLFLRAEGIVPAPEPSHAIAGVIREALAAKEAGEARVILFHLCGHGHFDMSAYDAFLSGQLIDFEYPQELIDAAIAELPEVSLP